MAVLKRNELTAGLKSAKGWKREGKGISKTFVFEDFVAAMGFVQTVAFLAEKMNHHPDVDIRWKKVTLILSTHSEGGITEKDLRLARQINGVA